MEFFLLYFSPGSPSRTAIFIKYNKKKKCFQVVIISPFRSTILYSDKVYMESFQGLTEKIRRPLLKSFMKKKYAFVISTYLQSKCLFNKVINQHKSLYKFIFSSNFLPFGDFTIFFLIRLVNNSASSKTNNLFVAYRPTTSGTYGLGKQAFFSFYKHENFHVLCSITAYFVLDYF